MKTYKLRTNTGVEYTAQLSDEDARARGLIEPETKKEVPENKKVTEDNPRVENKSTARRSGSARRSNK